MTVSNSLYVAITLRVLSRLLISALMSIRLVTRSVTTTYTISSIRTDNLCNSDRELIVQYNHFTASDSHVLHEQVHRLRNHPI